MGFKKTSDGRVFFQGTSNTPGGASNDIATPEVPYARPLTTTDPGLQQKAADQTTQLQMLTLLRALNEKLKNTQTERSQMRRELDEYRRMIESLEGKTQASEQAYQNLAQKLEDAPAVSAAPPVQTGEMSKSTLKELEDARKMLLALEERTAQTDQGLTTLLQQADQHKKVSVAISKKQAEIERKHREFEEEVSEYRALEDRLQQTENAQKTLDSRLENVLSEQMQIMHKLDTAIEDRTRFMRKIELIEETVIHTRDALIAGRMVPLIEDQPRRPSFQIGDKFAKLTRLWKARRPQLGFRIGPTTGITLIIAALLAGVFINEMQKPDWPNFERAQSSSPETTGDIRTSASVKTPAENRWSVSEDTSAFDAADEVLTQTPEAQDISSVQEAAPVPMQIQTPEILTADIPENDIGAIQIDDQDKLAELLEENPAQVAQILNTIEPGEEKTKTTQAVEEAPEPKPAKLIPTKEPSRQPQVQPRAKKTYAMRPDSSLPEVIKDIENQAYEGIAEAQHDLAAIYTAGHGGVKQDYKRAAYWFEQAGEGGIANANYNLGVLYHQGLGVKRSLETAISWYTKAAALGHPEAQYNLGIAYIEGIGVPYDPATAVTYFENAAVQGVMEAAYNLGLVYENGLLGAPKPDEALMWYKIAADKGSPEAKAALTQLAESLDISLAEVNRIAESMKKDSRLMAGETSAGENIDAQRDLVRKIQSYLMRIGLYPGPADGLSGPMTEDAVRTYQTENGLDADGVINEKLLTHMSGRN